MLHISERVKHKHRCIGENRSAEKHQMYICTDSTIFSNSKTCYSVHSCLQHTSHPMCIHFSRGHSFTADTLVVSVHGQELALGASLCNPSNGKRSSLFPSLRARNGLLLSPPAVTCKIEYPSQFNASVANRTNQPMNLHNITSLTT
jgi:hypothetical protein